MRLQGNRKLKKGEEDYVDKNDVTRPVIVVTIGYHSSSRLTVKVTSAAIRTFW